MSSGISHSGPVRERMAVFYRHVLATLDEARIPYLVGGSYASAVYTGIPPHTKDLDIFVRHEHLQQVLETARGEGYRSEVPFPHWLAKIHSGNGDFVDVIFSSGNGLCRVDDEWFANAERASVLGRPVDLCPVEEMIWSKAFVMERERFDGADVAHLMRARIQTLDWPRLLRRFGPRWRILLCHLVLFGFVYPHLRGEIPDQVMGELIERLREDQQQTPATDLICCGTLLSRQQYLKDIHEEDFADARLEPAGTMTASQIAIWTAAIEREHGSK